VQSIKLFQCVVPFKMVMKIGKKKNLRQMDRGHDDHFLQKSFPRKKGHELIYYLREWVLSEKTFSFIDYHFLKHDYRVY